MHHKQNHASAAEFIVFNHDEERQTGFTETLMCTEATFPHFFRKGNSLPLSFHAKRQPSEC